MNEILSQQAVGKMLLLFVFIAFMLLFWILENAWRNDKRWVIAILLIPLTTIIFVLKYWDENRAKCFFAGLYILTLILLEAVTGFSFVAMLARLLWDLAVWPYSLWHYFS